jgi:DNA polymerase III epsilon subunit-like protein
VATARTEGQELHEVVILDFETTGLSPSYDRVIEVGCATLRGGKVVSRFNELMNPGVSIPFFITRLTGISELMLANKPSPEKVMPKLKKYLGEKPIVAHNASFDKNFLYEEMARAGLKIQNPILCRISS